MKIFFSILFTIPIVLNFSSCTRIVYISRKTDPEINLENKHHDIVFVNLFDYTLPVNVNKKNILSYHDGTMGFLEGVSSFSRDSSFSFSVCDTLRKNIEVGFLTILLPADTIRTICNKFNSNLLLALDSMSIFFDRDTVINYNYGRRNSTINFVLYTSFFLSLYSDNGGLIERTEVDQSSIFTPRSAVPGFILVPSISGSREEIGILAFQSGQDYVAKFYPKIIQNKRQLYSDKPFKESNDYIFAKNWNKAIELLEQLAKNQDPAIAEKARHNLDIVKEASQAGSKH
jgi:hypothetical protein